jgi:hypothetical protein
MGHKLDGTDAAYFRANPIMLRDIYQKYVTYLTIQKEADISESPEYQRIKQENQTLQSETARHIVERQELQELHAKYENQKKELDSIWELLAKCTKDPQHNSIKVWRFQSEREVNSKDDLFTNFLTRHFKEL